MTDAWQAEARRTRRGRFNSWAISIGGAVLGTPAVFAGYQLGGVVGIALLAAGIGLLVLAFVYGTFVYMRRIDEQERMANLWATYVGVNVYALLFVLNLLLSRMGFRIADADILMFGATAVSILGVFAWLRFR